MQPALLKKLQDTRRIFVFVDSFISLDFLRLPGAALRRGKHLNALNKFILLPFPMGELNDRPETQTLTACVCTLGGCQLRYRR